MSRRNHRGEARQEVSCRRSRRSKQRPYPLDEAIQLAQGLAYAKFNETVELAMRLGVDPKHADQMVRGTVVLPHGLGKTKRVLVFASGEKKREAQEAGADHVGGDDMAKKIQGGWVDFDAVIATPDMMRVVGKLGKVLGPRGLMPNPKAGTVTFDVAKAVQEIKAGKVEFRVDKTGDHPRSGRQDLLRRRPAEGQRLRAHQRRAARRSRARPRASTSSGRALSSTMGPGIKVDEAALDGGRGLRRDDHADDPRRQRRASRRVRRRPRPRAERVRARLQGDHRSSGHRAARARCARAAASTSSSRTRWRCSPSTARRSPQLKEHFVGPTAVAYNTTDPVALAKALTEFAKDVPAVQFKGGAGRGPGGRGRPDPGHRQAAQPRGADREAALPDAVADHAASRACSRHVPQTSRWSSTRSGSKKEGPARAEAEPGDAGRRGSAPGSCRIRSRLNPDFRSPQQGEKWLSRLKIS